MNVEYAFSINSIWDLNAARNSFYYLPDDLSWPGPAAGNTITQIHSPPSSLLTIYND